MHAFCESLNTIKEFCTSIIFIVIANCLQYFCGYESLGLAEHTHNSQRYIVGRAPLAETRRSSMSVYISTDLDALSSYLSTKLTPSPKTLVVTPSVQHWVLLLANATRPRENKPASNLRYLHGPGQIRVSDPAQFKDALASGRHWQQILLDGVSPSRFYETNIAETLASLHCLTEETAGHLMLSLVVPDSSFITTIESSLRDTGVLGLEAVCCWLVASGNIPVRYLRFPNTALSPFTRFRHAFAPQGIFPAVKATASSHLKPLIEVTKS